MREARADAPGRVNLIGEHTDYHHGFVLPTVIPQRTRAHVVARSDRMVRATSRETGQQTQQYAIGAETVTHTWIDYVQGITHALRSVASALPGFELRLESDVPLGSGLSSSAALSVSVLRALREVFQLSYDDVELARIAQRVETEFVGAPIGIMDQMACSLARAGEALLLDTRTLSYQRIPLPTASELVVINSGVPHNHASGAYATRRRESFAAAALLGVEWLRDLDATALERINALPDPLNRRARHIVTENQRVHTTVEALSRGDLAAVGDLFYQSHASMRDDYETSTKELDRLVEIGREHPDVYGARLTGGGFGGSVVMLVRAGMGRLAASQVLSAYQSSGHYGGTILIPE